MATRFQSLVQLINPVWLRRHGLVPVSIAGNCLVISGPSTCSHEVLTALRFAAGCEVELVPAPPTAGDGEPGSTLTPNPSLADRIAAGFGPAPSGISHLTELAAIAIPVAFAWHGISTPVAILVGALALVAGVCLRSAICAEAAADEFAGAEMVDPGKIRQSKAIMHASRIAGASLFAIALVLLVQR